MKGVEVLFDEAAESGNEVLKIFDAGKFRYYYKNSLYQGVSAKKLHTVAPSLLERNGSIHGGLDEDLGIISVNLSSTLRKLCLWEKKLYHEVKAEEKLRLILAKNCGQMNILGEKVTDDSQVNSTQPLLRMLSTKITVSIQVIDNISITTSKLRDEELWPLNRVVATSETAAADEDDLYSLFTCVISNTTRQCTCHISLLFICQGIEVLCFVHPADYVRI